MPKRICVYCGSSAGNSSEYALAADALGKTMVKRGYDLVYGGASIGLMGELADTVLDAGGEAIGVMPSILAEKEIAHPNLTKLHVTASMHDRKSVMADLSDAFIALPGGLGTLEELFEIWTWGQLGFHEKPIALFNIDGYFDGILTFLDHAVIEGFIKGPHRDMLIESDSPDDLIDCIEDYTAPGTEKVKP